MNYDTESLQATYKAIDALMAVATSGMDANTQAEFEISALALYIGVQLATYPTERDRDMVLTSLVSEVRAVVAERDRVAKSAAE